MSMRVRIKDGWDELGRIGKQIGPRVTLDDQDWTPVLWDDEDDPGWHKTAGLEMEVTKEIPTKVWVEAKDFGDNFS